MSLLVLPIPVVQFLQVVTIAAAAPGVSGVIARVEARLQGRPGPAGAAALLRPGKLFRKEALAPEGSELGLPRGAASGVRPAT